MKRVVLSLFLTAFTFGAYAQSSSLIVYSQNKCFVNDVPKLNKMVDEVMGPVLNDLVKEGLLTNWGVLSHTWGDEWNWNIYYTAENIDKFRSAWQEMFERVQKKDGETFTKFGEWCFEHKDSMNNHSRGYAQSVASAQGW